jgi:hypothetical protein
MPSRGQPRKYANQKEGIRTRVQQHRERQRHPPQPAVPPSAFQNIFLAWDPRAQLGPTPPTEDRSNIFTDLQEALDAVPLDREETGPRGEEDDQSVGMEDG